MDAEVCVSIAVNPDASGALATSAVGAGVSALLPPPHPATKGSISAAVKIVLRIIGILFGAEPIVIGSRCHEGIAVVKAVCDRYFLVAPCVRRKFCLTVSDAASGFSSLRLRYYRRREAGAQETIGFIPFFEHPPRFTVCPIGYHKGGLRTSVHTFGDPFPSRRARHIGNFIAANLRWRSRMASEISWQSPAASEGDFSMGIGRNGRRKRPPACHILPFLPSRTAQAAALKEERLH